MLMKITMHAITKHAKNYSRGSSSLHPQRTKWFAVCSENYPAINQNEFNHDQSCSCVGIYAI